MIAVTLLLSVISFAQDTSSTNAAEPQKRSAVFRPTKDQIRQVQELLKAKDLYSGDATGTYNQETRAAIRSFQKDNRLRETGTLNRATLETMGIELTESQKAIPASESSYAPSAASGKKGTPDTVEKPKTSRSPIFRATKDQIAAAQRTLKTAGYYEGTDSGKLDSATRSGLRKYQKANGLKVTGTLNAVTLEKMGIELTDKQKADAAAGPASSN